MRSVCRPPRARSCWRPSSARRTVRHYSPSRDVASEVVLGSFTDAAEALLAACEAQRGGGGRWAVHTGEVIDTATTIGPALDRGLALLAIAGNGQILVSASTAGRVENRLPAGTTLVDRGIHRLQDLGRPEHVWQLTSDGVPAGDRELRSLSTFRHNLPTQLTPLIGRRADTDDVVPLVGSERLVTITGAGGVGKTRLALAVAAASLEQFPGGVWWVELAAVMAPGGAARAALAVLGAPEAPDAPSALQVAAALGHEPSLLVLDNCEHLIEDCAELVAGALAANPTATVLATSRELLGVPGEVTWRAPSLDAPSIDELDGATLYRSAASRLFVDRALRAEPTLSLDGAGTRAVAEICRRLDGIPLAIELAAARCRHLDPAQIGRELDDRFRLLTGGARTAVARQQTMAASIRWSHDRLDAGEQRTFRRLGVFTGTFPVEAAAGSRRRRRRRRGRRRARSDHATGRQEHGRCPDRGARRAEVPVVGDPEGIRGSNEPLTSASSMSCATSMLAGGRRGSIATTTNCTPTTCSNASTRCMTTSSPRSTGACGSPSSASSCSPGSLERGGSEGAAGDGIDAMEHLLTPEHAAEHPRAWVDAANFASFFISTFRGQAEGDRLTDLVEHTAAAIDDEYQLALVRWLHGATELIGRIRQLAHQRGDRFVEALAVIHLSRLFTNDDPEHAMTTPRRSARCCPRRTKQRRCCRRCTTTRRRRPVMSVS